MLLVGASGSGKSTFAQRHFRPTEIVSSDACRALVADDENALEANREAFRLLHQVASARLHLRRLVVVDATNLQPAPRRSWVTLAREHGIPAVAIVFDPPLGVLEDRALQRSDRSIPVETVRGHHELMAAAGPEIDREGFTTVAVLRSTEDAEAFVLERTGAPKPGTTSRPRLQPARWRRAWDECWPRKDVDGIARVYSEGASYRALAFRDAERGLEGVRRYLLRNFGVEDEVRCRFGEPIIGSDRAAVEWWASWLEGGRPMTLAGVTLLRFDADGLVIDHRDYWNQADGRLDPYPDW